MGGPGSGAGTQLSSKGSDDDLLLEFGYIRQVWVAMELAGVHTPMMPVFDASFGNLASDPIVHCLSCKQDIMHKASFDDGVHWSQECDCGIRNKCSKKYVRESPDAQIKRPRSQRSLAACVEVDMWSF
eukprot:9965601-Ditylum_brightwellii.AAC.1